MVQGKMRRTIVSVACVTVVTMALAVGCQSQARTVSAESGSGSASASTSASASASSSASSAPTLEELARMYPNEYATSMTHKIDSEGEDNSHAGFQALMETPAIRDVSGGITSLVAPDDPDRSSVALKCTACKTSRFVDLYEQNGVDAFTTMTLNNETIGYIAGAYCDCYSCHTWENGELTLQANCAYANADVFPKVAAFFATLDPEEAVCGQCHNTVSSRGYVQTDDDLQSYDPYRYGSSFEGRYQAMVEDGMYTEDEATGIKLVSMNHPQIEMVQGSVHQSLGVTCVDCHMNESTDENGTTFTGHDASTAPSTDTSAMEYCLTCHGSQDGLSTVDDMRAFLKEKQDAQAERQAEVEDEMSTLYDDILDAVNNGTMDDTTLQQAKDLYSQAYWYDKEQMQNLNDPADGTQIAHNPDLMRSMLEKADSLTQQGIALFA